MAGHFHFIFGLKPQTEPFHLVFYLCIRSCLEVNRPERIDFHYHHEPHGPWWEKTKPLVNAVRIDPEDFITRSRAYHDHQEGRYIEKVGLTYAHHSDFLRLKILIEQGGVYADMDTLFINPLPDDLLRREFAIGREEPTFNENGAPIESLCNALIIAQPGARFAVRWLYRMYQVFDGSWNRHCCIEPAILAREYPQDVCVLPERFFYPYSHTDAGIRALFTELNADHDNAYSMHLWSHRWWESWCSIFPDLNAGIFTMDYIRNVDTSYNVAARKFLD